MLFISSDISQEWMRKYETWRKFVVHLYSMRLKDLLTQHEIVTEQKNEIAEKSESINSSIRYASRIQGAVLPSHSYMQRILPEYFILNKPKDIVSGDFYWVGQKNNKLIVVAADSTGHGVPGAFMSMIGSRLLNELINEKRLIDPSDILTQLDENVKKALKQNKSKNDDGMDLCLCRIEKNTNNKKEIIFAGAKRPLFVKQANQKNIVNISGTRRSIGGFNSRNIRAFENSKLLLSTDDIIYLTTDGFSDQNNKLRKRFGTPRLVEILEQNFNFALQKQKEMLELKLSEWMEGGEQRDDITILAVKF